MSNAKELKNHIKSVSDTKKITNAMYLIASVKMRKAKSDLDKTRPYFNAVKNEIKRIFRTVQDVNSRYFYPIDGEKKSSNKTYACLVITADKGLAGKYNKNVLKEAEKMYLANPNTKFFVVGKFGRQYFYRHDIPIEKSFLYTAQNPTMHRAREISEILLELFDKNEVQKIYIIYTDMKNAMTEDAKTERLLPFHQKTFISKKKEASSEVEFEFLPDIEEVLDNIIPSYISGYIYSALVDSFCSEQNARMTAMNSAGKNAEKKLIELSAEYNRQRQAAVTQEIIEISSGAKAQRNKVKKENTREELYL